MEVALLQQLIIVTVSVTFKTNKSQLSEERFHVLMCSVKIKRCNKVLHGAKTKTEMIQLQYNIFVKGD